MPRLAGSEKKGRQRRGVSNNPEGLGTRGLTGSGAADDGLRAALSRATTMSDNVRP
jgi:hypothetical protein